MSPINGSGRMGVLLFLPSFVRESQTTTEEMSTVSTLAIAQEKPGMINPVINGYLLFARDQYEKNNNINSNIYLICVLLLLKYLQACFCNCCVSENIIKAKKAAPFVLRVRDCFFSERLIIY